MLDGHVQRADVRLRVTAQLVRVDDGALLWAEKFDEQFTHIFAIQHSISEQVARTLLLRLSGEQQQRLTKRYTEDPKAYELFLRGVYETNKGTKKSAHKTVEFFGQAIEKDPGYARAYAGLADAWCWLSHLFIDPKEALPQAKAAALKALEMDETLAETHLALGRVKMWYEWDWEGCAREFQRALELNPHLAHAHIWYALYLTATEQFDEGEAEAGMSLELDPLSLNHNAMTGWVFYLGRRYERACEQFRRVIGLEPTYFMAYWGLGWALMHQERYEEAIEEIRKGQALGGGAEFCAGLSHVHARAGRTEEARRLLDELRESSKQRSIAPFYFALAHVGLGEIDETFAALELAFRDRFEWVLHCRVSPEWDPLRSDPRFADLLRRIGIGAF